MLRRGLHHGDKPKDFGDDKTAKYLGNRIRYGGGRGIESHDLDFTGSEATKDRNAMIQKRDSDAEKRVF